MKFLKEKSWKTVEVTHTIDFSRTSLIRLDENVKKRHGANMEDFDVLVVNNLEKR